MSEVAPTNRRDTAFESGNEERIQAVLAVAIENPEVIPGLISSLGWMEWATAEPHIRNLQASDSPLLRRIGLAASAIHRKDPGQALVDVIQSDDIPLKACALRAVGELGVRGLTNHLTSNFKSEVEELRFYAAWSATLLGDGYAAEVLKSVAEAKSRFAEKAIHAAMRRMELTRAQDWLQDIIRSPRTRMAVIGAGILGDPSFVPWLLEQMNIPILARVAGEAITGECNAQREDAFIAWAQKVAQ